MLIVSPSAHLRGGVETILHDLCKELPKRGWTPVLGLADGGNCNDATRYATANPDLPVRPVRTRFFTTRARVAAIQAAIRKTAPDVVMMARIADTFAAVAGLKLAAATTGRAAPLLGVAVRGLEAQYLQDVALFRDFVDGCFVDGRILAEATVELAGMPRERVFNLPGGVRHPVVPVTPRDSGTLLRLGYVGRLAHADKRALDLIRLVAELEGAGVPFILSIVGDGPDRTVLETALSGPERRGRVLFLGWCDHTSLYGEVLPRLGERLPVHDAPQSRLERMGLPGVLADRLRAALGRAPSPAEPGAEWPHGWRLVSPTAQAKLIKLAQTIDDAMRAAQA